MCSVYVQGVEQHSVGVFFLLFSLERSSCLDKHTKTHRDDVSQIPHQFVLTLRNQRSSESDKVLLQATGSAQHEDNATALSYIQCVLQLALALALVPSVPHMGLNANS